MKKIWLVGGTGEARKLVQELAQLPLEIYVSVATDYGAKLLKAQDNVHIQAARLDLTAMRAFLQKLKPECAIDATHPYATIVTATLESACAAENVEYLRLLRPAAAQGNYIFVADFLEAVELLNNTEGMIFLTTGSKNLPDFTQVTDYAERIALRILPLESSLAAAVRLGYKAANIVCMQGPFDRELDIATFKKYQARFVVTKDSGTAGGFEEKAAAAAAIGAKLIVVGRQSSENGCAYAELLAQLKQRFAID